SREEPRERILLCVSLAAGLEACAFAADLAKAVARCRGREILLICLGPSPPAVAPPLGAQELRRALRGGEAPELRPFTSSIGESVGVLSLSDLTPERDLRLIGPLLGLAVAQYGGAVVASERTATGSPERADAGIGAFTEEALRQSDAAIVVVDATDES